MVDAWRGQIDDNFGWVILIACMTWFLNFAQMFMIGRRRKWDNVPPPIMYAEDKPKFNGAQRAHQNTLENVPFFLVMLLLAGLRHPEEAAGLGGGWILARLIFTVGYWTGKPKYRMPGFILTLLVQLALIGFSISTAGGYLDWW